MVVAQSEKKKDVKTSGGAFTIHPASSKQANKLYLKVKKEKKNRKLRSEMNNMTDKKIKNKT